MPHVIHQLHQELLIKCLFVSHVSLDMQSPSYSCLPYQHGIIHYVREGSGNNAGEHQADTRRMSQRIYPSLS